MHIYCIFTLYNHGQIEKKWQKYWDENKSFVFDVQSEREKYYVLEMFPYPSGKIHMGHVRNYTIGDVVARFKKMQGFNVLHPIGWDAFGLPAENAAIEGGVHPLDWTLKNISEMKASLKKIGFSYDWGREVATCLDTYYRHEQEMFIKFYNAGIAYQKESFVNWDPVDNTVLANEQVIDGKGWRSGAKVERKKLKQWFLKVSEFSEELLNGLQFLPEWPEKVKLMQKNWIGKSEGAKIDFEFEQKLSFLQNSKQTFEIETKNLYARPFTEDDFDLLFELHSDSVLMQNIGNGTAKTKQEVQVQLANAVDCYKKNGVSILAIFDKKTGNFIGRSGIVQINSIIKSDKVEQGYNMFELGYLIKEEYWGKSYAMEVALGCIEWFFTNTSNESLYAKATKRNIKSIAILDRLGFVKQDVEIKSENSPAFLFKLTRQAFCDLASKITVFTTRSDTIFGASFVALSAFHSVVDKITFATNCVNFEQINSFVKMQEALKVSTEEVETMEKQGLFTGFYALNPADKNQKLPVYLANFVLTDYGTGALFGCPAHDERDFEFANKYNLPIKQVVTQIKGAIIDGESFYTRPLTEADIEQFKAVILNPQVAKHLKGYADSAEQKLKYYIEEYNKNRFGMMAVIEKNTEKFMGYAGVSQFKKRHTEDDKNFEVIYVLSPEFWGRGLGSSLCYKVCEWAFYNVDIDGNLCAVIDGLHDISRKILLSFGFASKSRKVIDGYGDEEYFELNVNDFKFKKCDKCVTGLGFSINSSYLNGLDSESAKKRVIDLKIGQSVVSYKLRDWGVSRQRYWGCPIPILHCDSCGAIAESLQNLPVRLPYDVDFVKTGNPLYNHQTWKNATCPKCQKPAQRETDTFDTFFESSWYFLRFVNPFLSDGGFDNAQVSSFMPVDEYIGGIEHAILHLLYSRFFVKALSVTHGIKIPNGEPFKRLITQGMVCHKTFKHKATQKWLTPEEASNLDKSVVEVGDSIKMSKSKKNVVSPDVAIESYGADAIRMFVVSDSPPDKDIEWSGEGIEGVYRFLKKVYVDIVSFKDLYLSANSTPDDQTKAFVYQILKEYELNMVSMVLNKCIAEIRKLFNAISQQQQSENKKYMIQVFLKLLNPFCPHIAEEIWSILQHSQTLHVTQFDKVDPSFLLQKKAKIAIQLNGKMKGVIECDDGLDEASVLRIASQQINSIKAIDLQSIKKTIFVKDKVLNIVM